MLTNQLIKQARTISVERQIYNDVNRMLAAAIVSSQFCNLLLNDPASALEQGFAGERFAFSTDEYEMIIAIRSSSLTDFAEQIYKSLSRLQPSTETSLSDHQNIGSWPM